MIALTVTYMTAAGDVTYEVSISYVVRFHYIKGDCVIGRMLDMKTEK